MAIHRFCPKPAASCKYVQVCIGGNYGMTDVIIKFKFDCILNMLFI
jgi:hypothetical protein